MIEFKKGSLVLHRLLITIFALQTCLYSQAQVAPEKQGDKKISITGRNITLLTALKRIEKQTGLRFNYRPEQLNITEKVTLEYREKTLNEVLDGLLTPKGFIWKYIDNYISLQLKNGPAKQEVTPGTEKQENDTTVTGIVTDNGGRALAGVSIGVLGSHIGTSSNSDGSFVLRNVPINSSIILSSVGYETKKVKLNNRFSVLIELDLVVKDIQPVEVVSTGYQDIPKERATGSFVKVENETLNQQVGTNILQRLDGVTNSLLFKIGKGGNSKTHATIRGESTINGPLDPLIVLDNFIYEGNIENVNPNDIENVTILRDAVATSIYGARGGNGVIVLTTKKGRFNQKVKVEFNSNIMVSEKPNLFYLPQISSGDYVDVEQFLYSKGLYNSLFTRSSRPAISPAVEIFRKRDLGQITSLDSAAQIDALKNIDSRDQFTDLFYQNSITQQYAINLRGGSNNIAWLASGSYNRNIDNLKGAFNKTNIRIENSYKPFNGFQVNVGAYYTKSTERDGAINYNDVIKVGSKSVPYLNFSDENGHPLAIAKDYREIYTDTAGAGRLLNWKYYPLEDYKHDRRTAHLEEIVANTGVSYQIFTGLQFNLNYQYQKQTTSIDRESDMESYNTRNTINRFSQLNRSTGIVNYIVPKGGILNRVNSTINTQNIRGQLNFNNSWNNHSISSIMGGELREIVRSGSSTTIYGYNEDPLSFGTVDFINRYPIFTSGTSTIPGGPSLSKTTTSRFVSLYINAQYTYHRRYSFSFSGRKDASNTFGLSTNEKWKPLWSAGLGWEVSQEDFFKPSWISYLKIRSTYGYSGNVDLSKSAVPVAVVSTDAVTNLPYGVISTINNPSLRWEEVRQINFGVDFSLKNNYLKGTIDYYLKKATDLYGPTPYDYTTWGFTNTIVKNVASMSGNGFDVMLQSNNINRSLKWQTSLLFSYQTNKTTSYFANSADRISTLISNGNSISPVIGKPLYSIAAYKWGGLDSLGNPRGYLNGQLSTDYNAIITSIGEKDVESGSIIYVGQANPKVYGSLINELTWRDFSFSINVSYKFGYYFRRPSLSYDALVSSGIGHKEYADRWQNPGDEYETNVPSFIYPNVSFRDAFYTLSEINVEKADHIRLQYINLGYGFNPKGRKGPFARLEFYANLANLGILWRANSKGLDPDYPSAIPPSRSFAFGIRAITRN